MELALKLITDLLNNIESIKLNVENTVVIINGCVGVGKTSTGDALNEMISNSIFFDGDAFYQHSSLNFSNNNNWYNNWISIICTNIDLHLNKLNTSNFVISYVFEDQQSILKLVNSIKSIHNFKNASIYYFVLTADLNVIHQRIRKRALSLYDNDDFESLNWDLNRSKELQNILFKKHLNLPHCLGQMIDTTNFKKVNQVSMYLKSIINKYEYNLNNWKDILSKYDINRRNDFYLQPMDFLNQFKDIIVKREKRATTRWLKGEQFQVDLQANKWMIATINNGKTPFGILFINKVESYKLIEINDQIAKIENMDSGKELILLLKQIYPKINNSDTVKVVYFTCCHYF